MSEAARRLKANRKLEGKPCGWCQQPLALGEDAAVCLPDETVHHARCWDERAGCSIPGCPQAPLRRLDAPPPPQFVAAAPVPVSVWDSAVQSRPPQRAALRPGFKFCTGCGNQVLQDTQICDFCNAILTPDGIYSGPQVNAPGAVASLVYGLIGMLFCGVIFGTLAIVKSREARAAIAFNPRYSGGGMATAGLILGILGLVTWGILILVRIGGAS